MAYGETTKGACDFLLRLRPGGPWPITAIRPDGNVTTITANTVRAIETFVDAHNGQWNLYYTLNPIRGPVSKKPLKADISCAEYVHADLDPSDGEESDQAKARYRRALDKFTPPPSAIIDSGNGLQVLWRLAEPIPPERFPQVEAVSKAVMLSLGSVAGTQNVDRLLRLPGTLNLPTKAKLAKGRAKCASALIEMNESTCRLDDFPPPVANEPSDKGPPPDPALDWANVDSHAGWLRSADDLPSDFSAKGRLIVGCTNLEKLNAALQARGAQPYASGSEVTMALAAIFKADMRYPLEQIAAALLCDLPCNQHVIGMANVGLRRRAVERALFRSYQPKYEAPTGSEDAIALAYVHDHHHELRYVAEIGKWFRWDGTRWASDRTVAAFDMIRPYLRRAAALLGKSQQRGAARAVMVAGVEKLARSDRRVAAVPEDFDVDIWALNTPGGIVDLHTGDLRPCDPAAMCSKATAVAPAPPGTDAPRWKQFLSEITDRDDALIAFLARMCGYMLTGSTQEHALFFGWGDGANGKSVFVGTVRGMMGDYAVTTPAETFLASRYERHPTELADLRGARLVVASEINHDQKWNESRIKAVTGGDPVKARFMRQDFFQFEPQFKPLIVGNNQPSLESVDEAIRRRMCLLPFDVVIPPDQRDKNLTDKLREEWPAILRWAIDGCLEWHGKGLAPPPRVIEATKEYLTAEDLIEQWLRECCTRDPSAFSSSTDLFLSWDSWAESNHAPRSSQKAFVQELKRKQRGLTYDRRSTARGFQGVALAQAARSDGWAGIPE